MAAESGCVMAFTGGSPTSGNAPVDLLGNIDAAGGFAENALGTIPEDRCFRYIGDRYITGIVGSTYAPPAASFPDPIILGDLRVRCGFVYRTGSTFIVGNFATGESANTDYPWSANMNGGNRIRWFSETLGGRNIDIQWTLPETLNGGDAREFEMIKSDNGDGTSDLSVKWYWPGSPDGEILNTVASISVQSPATAVDNGSYVTITNTTDASLTQFGLSANAPVRYCVIYDTVP